MCPFGTIYSSKCNIQAEMQHDFKDSLGNMPGIIIYDFACGLATHINLSESESFPFKPFERWLSDLTPDNITITKERKLNVNILVCITGSWSLTVISNIPVDSNRSTKRCLADLRFYNLFMRQYFAVVFNFFYVTYTNLKHQKRRSQHHHCEWNCEKREQFKTRNRKRKV